MMWSQIRDGLHAYEVSKRFGPVMFWETVVASCIIGGINNSLWVGVIAFLGILIAWSLPLIGTIMMVTVSGLYGYLVWEILRLFGVHSALCFLGLALTFLVAFGSHVMTAGNG